MLNETDLQEYYEQLKREERKIADKKVSDLQDLLDEQQSLIHAQAIIQAKIMAKLAGFKV